MTAKADPEFDLFGALAGAAHDLLGFGLVVAISAVCYGLGFFVVWLINQGGEPWTRN